MINFKKSNLKKGMIMIFFITLIFLGILVLVNYYQYRKYNLIINQSIDAIVNLKKGNEDAISEEEILKILNGEYNGNSITKKYGYDEKIGCIKELNKLSNQIIIFNIFILVIFSSFISILYYYYSAKQDEKLKKINKYVKEVSNRNYELDISENTEDELSKLRNELYKITVSLKESAENSLKEKENLSTSIVDISHQLKTPLTSIRIMLDNILENENMEQEVKNDFIKEISNQIDWITSLIKQLLKLSKFDAGVIVMKKEEVNIKQLIENIKNNLSIILDIKNVNLVINIGENETICIDKTWEMEALTNIIKNAIEHSNENSKIYITVDSSSLFLKIDVRDEGKGISKEDLNHIFERFYKSKNSNENSIGIGLSLAKMIIEKDDGYINVKSEEGKGTIFEIKYIK